MNYYERKAKNIIAEALYGAIEAYKSKDEELKKLKGLGNPYAFVDHSERFILTIKDLEKSTIESLKKIGAFSGLF
jgi:hypothetical protein